MCSSVEITKCSVSKVWKNVGLMSEWEYRKSKTEQICSCSHWCKWHLTFGTMKLNPTSKLFPWWKRVCRRSNSSVDIRRDFRCSNKWKYQTDKYSNYINFVSTATKCINVEGFHRRRKINQRRIHKQLSWTFILWQQTMANSFCNVRKWRSSERERERVEKTSIFPL